MNRRFLIAGALLLALAPVAAAHGPKGTKVTGANGGEIVDVDGGHIELVVKPTELVLYITDLKDVPLATAGLTARAVVQDGTKQAVVPLAPREPNLMAGPLAAPLSTGARVVISATLAKGGKPIQARFVVK